jgi:hypothetical protein
MLTATTCRQDGPARERAGTLDVLGPLLDGLAAVVVAIPADVYVGRPVPEVSGSIGAQVRHTLDHIAAFLGSTPTARLSYDHRERATRIESDPASALRTIFRLKAALGDCSDARLASPVEVDVQLTPSGESLQAWSSHARELAFVQSHTIHHQAIIALLMVIQGCEPPAGFGYAPATPRP